MSIIEGGVRMKGTFSVAKSRYNGAKAFHEYQLLDPNGQLYQRGAWVRERDLRLEKRATR